MSDLPKTLENLTPASIRHFIAELEKTMLESDNKIDVPIEHMFSRNVYAREMKLPAGALIVGKIHKHQNLNIISQGEVSLFSEETGMRKIKAPYTFVSAPGAKRIIYAHSDVVWTTIHGTSETDLQRIEDEVIAKDYSEVVALTQKEPELILIKGDQKCLGSL